MCNKHDQESTGQIINNIVNIDTKIRCRSQEAVHQTVSQRVMQEEEDAWENNNTSQNST